MQGGTRASPSHQAYGNVVWGGPGVGGCCSPSVPSALRSAQPALLPCSSLTHLPGLSSGGRAHRVLVPPGRAAGAEGQEAAVRGFPMPRGSDTRSFSESSGRTRTAHKVRTSRQGGEVAVGPPAAPGQPQSPGLGGLNPKLAPREGHWHVRPLVLGGKLAGMGRDPRVPCVGLAVPMALPRGGGGLGGCWNKRS